MTTPFADAFGIPRTTAALLLVAVVVLILPREVRGQGMVPGGQNGWSGSPAAGQAPAGSGGMTIPSASFAADPASLQNGANPQDVDSEGVVESAGEASGIGALYARISQGGLLMIPLAVCSLVVIALAIERLVALRRGRVIPRPFVRRFTECVEDGQLSYDEAAAICDDFECPVAEVFHAAVKRWGRPVLEVEQAVMDAGDRVADSLRRFLRVFHAISNVAPLLGLLGTVLGMIEAFDTMATQEAVGRPEMLASGISVALMTTAGGLSVAIPAYLAYIYFTSRADRYLGEIDRLCQQVIESISAEGLQQASGSGRSTRKTKRAA